jgi:hypothetical protein
MHNIAIDGMYSWNPGRPISGAHLNARSGYQQEQQGKDTETVAVKQIETGSKRGLERRSKS